MESSFSVDNPRKIELLRRQRMKEPGHGDIFWETNDNGIKSYQFRNWALGKELQWCWPCYMPAVVAILRD